MRAGELLLGLGLVLAVLYVVSRTKTGFDLFFRIPGSVESAEA